MAGVIFNLDGPESRIRYSKNGIYSTRMRRPEPSGYGWRTSGEATIADFVALKEDDLVFFFENRMIYGIGRVVKMPQVARAALCNYPRSWDIYQETLEETYLWTDEPDSLLNHPFVVYSEPCPAWFKQGIDMDEALASDAHGYLSVLPFFAGVSFARLDDFEAAHLAALIRRSNQDGAQLERMDAQVHAQAKQLLSAGHQRFEIDTDALVRQYTEGDAVRHEALLEAWLMDACHNRWELVEGVMGRTRPWTFIGRQVPASPFKPPDYIDRADMLAYDIAPPTEVSRVPIASSYMVAELKKDRASADNIRQVLKYVDWIAHKYQGGDYAGISAMMVTAGYSDEIKQLAAEEGRRDYVRPRRPYDMNVWQSLKLVQYKVTDEGPAIALREVPYDR